MAYAQPTAKTSSAPTNDPKAPKPAKHYFGEHLMGGDPTSCVVGGNVQIMFLLHDRNSMVKRHVEGETGADVGSVIFSARTRLGLPDGSTRSNPNSGLGMYGLESTS